MIHPHWAAYDCDAENPDNKKTVGIGIWLCIFESSIQATRAWATCKWQPRLQANFCLSKPSVGSNPCSSILLILSHRRYVPRSLLFCKTFPMVYVSFGLFYSDSGIILLPRGALGLGTADRFPHIFYESVQPFLKFAILGPINPSRQLYRRMFESLLFVFSFIGCLWWHG